MAKVKEWIIPFLSRYRARILPHDWPDPSPVADSEEAQEWVEFLRGWVTGLALARVTEDEADAALNRLTLVPPRFRRDHIPALVQVVESIRAANAPASKPVSLDQFDRMPPLDMTEQAKILSVLIQRPPNDPIGNWARRQWEGESA